MGEFREVENGGGAFNGEGGDVVSTCGHFRGGESAEPDPAFFSGFTNFGNPLSPSPHSDPTENRVFTIVVVIFSRPFPSFPVRLDRRRRRRRRRVMIGNRG